MHVLWGEDDFLLRERAVALLDPALEVTEVDAGEWRGGELADLQTPSLFGDRRALMVTDLRSLPDLGMRELAAYLSAPDPDTPLLLLVTVAERGKIPAAIQKIVEPAAEIEEVRLVRKDLQGWLVNRAGARGLELTPDGAAALIDAMGEDPAALASSIEQLASAFRGARVTREEVSNQFRGLGEQHIWDLCDRMFARDLAGSVRSIRSLLAGGDAGIAILGGIAARLRDLIRVKAQPDRMSPADLAKATGIRFDWQAKRYREQASRFSMEELIGIHALIVEADRALKTGSNDDVVMPMLVATIVGGAAA